MLGRNTIHLPGFIRVGAAIASVVLAGGFVPTAYGQVTKTGPALTANSQLITQLRSVHTLLHEANHDYDGYRAKASHQVTEAIHALEGIKNPPKKHKPIHNLGKKAAIHEPQSVSDAQLNQALQQLQTLQPQLTSSSAANVAAAGKHVGQAIADLQTALKIK
jgi:hypothetical protein